MKRSYPKKDILSEPDFIDWVADPVVQHSDHHPTVEQNQGINPHGRIKQITIYKKAVY